MFTLNTLKINSALKLIGNINSKESNAKVYNNSLIDIQKDKLIIKNCSLNNNITIIFDEQFDQEAKFCVPTKKAHKVFDLMSTEEVDISFDKDKVIIQDKDETTSFKLPTISVDMFPDNMTLPQDFDIKIDGEDFYKAFTSCYATQREDRLNRAFVLGFKLVTEGTDKLHIYSVDVASILKATVPCEVVNQLDLILQKEDLINMFKSIGYNNEIKIKTYPKHITISIDSDDKEFHITSQLLEGQFPDLDAVLNDDKEYVNKATINKDLLIDVLTRASILSDIDFRHVKVKLSTDKMDFHYINNKTVSSVQESIDIEYSGEEIVLNLGVRKLLNILKYSNIGDNVTLNLLDGMSKILIGDNGIGIFKSTLMPMRI